MKTTKLTVKFFLIISLFASIALADDGQMGSGGFADDGQMGSGGYTCNEEVETCSNEDGQMGSGGFADSMSIFIKDYLAKLLG